MNKSLPECCREFQITNRADLIGCIRALEDTNGMSMEALKKRLDHLHSMRNKDYLVMFEEDEGLLDIYAYAKDKIQRALRNLQKPE